MNDNLPEKKDNWLDGFEGLRPDLFFPESWTDEQKQEALAEVSDSRMKTTMFTSIPMNCRAKDCPIASSCPLLKKGLAPKGKPCPIETSIIHKFTQDFMEENNVDPDNLVEVSMVRDLVDQEIQYIRKSKVLADEHFIQESVVGIDDDGKPILSEQLHSAVDFEDRIHKRRKDIRKEMILSREARLKAAQGDVDSAKVLSKLMTDVTALEQVRKKEAAIKLGLASGDETTDKYTESILEADIIEDEDS